VDDRVCEIYVELMAEIMSDSAQHFEQLTVWRMKLIQQIF